MQFEKLLVTIKTLVEQKLHVYLRIKLREAQKLHPDSLELAAQVADLTLRAGKRTRAFLVWLSYQTTNNSRLTINKKIPAPLLSVMMALELFQTFALIHDDIIDKDLERRGGPTVHEHFRLKTQTAKLKTQDPKHVGMSLAILAGDLALGWAWELMDETGSETVQKLFSQMSQETIFGQTLDVFREQTGKPIDKARIDELKTAYYGVVRPLELGAVLAGASPKTLKALGLYGLVVGAAFQLRDDVLDGKINELVFAKKVKPQLSQALKFADKLPIALANKEIYRDFAKFVVIRKT